EDDRAVVRAVCDRGRYEIGLSQRELLAAHDADQSGHRRDPERQRGGCQRRAEDRRKTDGEDKERERKENGGCPCDHRFRPAAVVAARSPSGTATSIARTVGRKPTCIEARAPQTRRERTSRPRSSVPSRCCHEGCASGAAKSTAFGLYRRDEGRERRG